MLNKGPVSKAYAPESSSFPSFPLLGGMRRSRDFSKAFSLSSHSCSRAASMKRCFWVFLSSFGLLMGGSVRGLASDVI